MRARSHRSVCTMRSSYGAQSSLGTRLRNRARAVVCRLHSIHRLVAPCNLVPLDVVVTQPAPPRPAWEVLRCLDADMSPGDGASRIDLHTDAARRATTFGVG